MAGPFLERVFRVKGGCSCYGRTDAADGWYFAPAAVDDADLCDGFEAKGPFRSEAVATEQAMIEEREWSARVQAEALNAQRED